MQDNLQTQFNLHQIPRAIFTELEQKKLNLYGNIKDPK